MELYELGIGLPGLSIATLMELLDDNIEPYRQADRARLTRQARRHCPGPAPGVRREQSCGRARRRPGSTIDALAAQLGCAAVDRELEAAMLTSVTTCCRTSGGEPPERAAARKAHRSVRASAPATPSARWAPPVGIALLAN